MTNEKTADSAEKKCEVGGCYFLAWRGGTMCKYHTRRAEKYARNPVVGLYPSNVGGTRYLIEGRYFSAQELAKAYDKVGGQQR